MKWTALFEAAIAETSFNSHDRNSLFLHSGSAVILVGGRRYFQGFEIIPVSEFVFFFSHTRPVKLKKKRKHLNFMLVPELQRRQTQWGV